MVLGLNITNVASFEAGGAAARDPGLPGRSPDVFDALGVLEDGLGLLEGLARRLGEQEEDVDEHGDEEDGEDEVRLPLDVGKGLGDEEAQRRVEGPVTRRGQRDALASESQGEQLRRVGPGDWTPGGSEGCDEPSPRVLASLRR